jgi:hypothetical protein
MAMMEIKILERQIMSLHLQENADKYVPKLQESLTTIIAAITAMDGKISALKSQQPQIGGLINRLKKTVGKDAETQNAKALVKMMDEREGYIKQKTDVEAQIKQYQEMSVDS